MLHRTSLTLARLCLVAGISALACLQSNSEEPSVPKELKYHGHSVASDPGKVVLSLEQLYRLDPQLAPPSTNEKGEKQPSSSRAIPGHNRVKFIEMLKEHMVAGDSRAAVVVSTKPLLVAAYTDELDCVVMLEFPESLVKDYDLKPGSRLLTVNTYPTRGDAKDLHRGPKELKRYKNVFPVIADFFAENRERVDKRKTAIPEEEWERCTTLGNDYHERYPKSFRNGAPSQSEIPKEPEAGELEGS